GTPMQRIAFDAMRWHYTGQVVEEIAAEDNFNRVTLLNSIIRNTIRIYLNNVKRCKAVVSLFDVTGSAVYSITVNSPAGKSIKEIDVSCLSPGVYFIKIAVDGLIYREKFIKVR
ncbi:MAG: T9SS type A sorting domain-containing protein, partial [candidate division WOR-3 bacterium]|nr:T9SS type A sorting domain-containing protein [candidate division WOR-3 bacterium]